MPKPYFTRKNLIALSVAFLYAFVFLFTGYCMAASRSNVIQKFAVDLFGFNNENFEGGKFLFIFLLLVAIYSILFVAAIIYEIRYAVINNKKAYSAKMFLVYFATLVVCLLLSFGLAILIDAVAKEPISAHLKFVGLAMGIAAIISFGIAALIAGVLLFVVNFVMVDKPFRFFNKNNLPILDDNEEDDVVDDIKDNFDVDPATTVASAATTGGVLRQAEELDDREKVFPSLSRIDVQYDGFVVDKFETDDVSLEELCTKFRNYLAKKEKLYFDVETIRFFVSSFAASHFMILEGLSGTGKSSLPRYFAEFVGANLLFVPVQATWRDKTNLIGYFNDFSKTYSETDFLLAMYHGNYNPDMIHIYVLDEMNISRVEYYFADFLSVLEYPVNEWNIKLMQLPFNFIPPAKLMGGILNIPENSYFVGTANKDDSTFTITDKVYDRAITMDFETRNEAFTVKEDVAPIKLSQSKLKELYQTAKDKTENQMTKADYDKLNVIADYINEQFDVTFGNRIQNQIDELVPVYVECGGKKEEAIDFLISRKVISKLEGRFEEYVRGALKELLSLIEKTYGKGVLVRSEKTIETIIRRL